MTRVEQWARDIAEAFLGLRVITPEVARIVRENAITTDKIAPREENPMTRCLLALALLTALLVPGRVEAQSVLVAIETAGCVLCAEDDTVGAVVAIAGLPEGAPIQLVAVLYGPDGVAASFFHIVAASVPVTRVPLFERMVSPETTHGAYILSVAVQNASVVAPPFFAATEQTFWRVP